MGAAYQTANEYPVPSPAHSHAKHKACIYLYVNRFFAKKIDVGILTTHKLCLLSLYTRTHATKRKPALVISAYKKFMIHAKFQFTKFLALKRPHFRQAKI